MHSFDDKAADWDSPVHIERAVAIAAAIRQAVPLGPATRVIDIGAGTGLLGRRLAPHVRSVVLADPSGGMLEAAAAAAAEAGLSNVTTLRYALASDMPPDGRFDLAVSLMALHHVGDTDLALRHIAEMLAPGGWIAVADLDAEDGSYHADPEESAAVLHGYDRDDLGRQAAAAGFDAVAFADVWEIEKFGRHYTLFLMTARLA